MSFFYASTTHSDFAILVRSNGLKKQHVEKALWRIRSLSCQHSDILDIFEEVESHSGD